MVIPDFGPCATNSDPSLPELEESKTCGDCACSEEIKPPKTTDRLCLKCKTNRATRLLKNEQVCGECYQFNLTHRFKNTLVRYCRIQKDFPNLVAVSGGSNSMAMLHMLWNCLSGNKSQKKMFFKVHVLYIEEGIQVFGISSEEAERRRNLIIRVCESYQFTYTIIQLEAVYEVHMEAMQSDATDLESIIYQKISADLPMNKVMQCTNGATSKISDLIRSVEPSFQADLVLFLKKWLIADFCIRYNFKRVLVATTGHGIAVKLLSQLSKGRGASIADQVSYCGEVYFGQRVTFCKPMRDFL